MSQPSETPGRLARTLSMYRGEGLPRVVKALSLTSLLQDVASEMVYPLLPRFLLLLGGGPALLGAMETAAELVLTAMKGAAGRWSDLVGRRKPFVSAGYGISALTRPLMAAAKSVGLVIAWRSLDRIAKGLRTAPRDALIAEATPPERRAFAFSFHRGLDHLGAAIGPLVAFLVLQASSGSLRLVFLAATLPALAGWAVVQRGLPAESRRSGIATAPSQRKARSRVPPRLWLPLAAFFVFGLGNASDAFLLLRAGEAGVSASGVTLLWSAFHVVKWLSATPSGRLADSLGRRAAVLLGWLLYAAVYAGFAFAEQPLPLLALFVPYALFFGLTEGAERALVLDLAGAGLGAGSTLGVFHFASGLGLTAASLVFGLVWRGFGPTTAFLFGAGLAGLAALLLAASTRTGGLGAGEPS